MALKPIRWGTQLTLFAGIVWLTAGPSAQSLGDVARKEAARRQQVDTGKKYTNDDLRADVASAPVQPAVPAPADPTATAVPADEKGEPGEKTDGTAGTAAEGESKIAAPREKRDEKYWRDRSSLIGAKLNEAEQKVKSLQQRLTQLEEALGQGGPSVTQERAVTFKSLTLAQNAYNSAKDEWTRMENRARAAKVPEEWIK
jgi:hypothetical protein